MIMADVFKILFLTIGGLVIVISYWLIAEALFTKSVRRARDLYAGHAVRTTLVGALAGVPITFIGIALISSGAGASIGIPVLSIAVVAGLFGSAGLARLIGEGLPSERDDREPWRAVMRGGAVLSLACLLPFAGWFILLPLALASGLGAIIQIFWPARLRQRKSEAVDGAHA